MTIRPPLNALRAFEAAARHLSFRSAADELHVTQAAVAQHVRGLEALLGMPLFQRLPRRLVLSDEGAAYADSLRKAFTLIDDATQALLRQPARLTISVTPTFASKWLIPRLPDFMDRHPQIDLRILATPAISDFQADGVDIAVRQGRPPFGPSLRADFLFAQDVMAVCSPALQGRPLQQQVLLHDAHNLWPAFLGQHDPAGGKHLRFNQTSLAVDAALAGQGVALVSRFLVQQDLAAGRLVQALPGTLRGEQDFHVIAPQKPRHPEAVQSVRSWLLGSAA